jgi:hypothetical protein
MWERLGGEVEGRGWRKRKVRGGEGIVAHPDNQTMPQQLEYLRLLEVSKADRVWP